MGNIIFATFTLQRLKINTMNISKIEVARILRTNQTLAERKLWEQIRARRFMGLKFRRQHPLKGYVVDFYCHKVNLVIEVDGGIHENTRELDEYRQREVMVKSEASFLRFTNEEVLDNIEAVMERISFFITEIHKQKKRH
jgi:uroporphyrinogen-III synthase